MISWSEFFYAIGVRPGWTVRGSILLAFVLTLFLMAFSLVANASTPITATVNGSTCAVSSAVYQTGMVEIDCDAKFFVCAPGQTIYRASYELVPGQPCRNDRVFKGDFQ